MIKHFTELVSKMATLPFTEFMFVKENMFQQVLMAKPNERFKIYDNIKKRIQQELIGKQHFRSVDTLNLLFEQYFPYKTFASDSENDIYLEKLYRLSNSFITHRNGRISLKYWKNANDEYLFGAFEDLQKVEVWNTLSRMFCIDILVVIYLLRNNMRNPAYLNGYYWLIHLGDMQLDKLMERGLAETHIHISMGVNFNIMWQDLMNINREESRIRIKAIWNLIDDPHLEFSLRIGSIVRVLLFKYLTASEKNGFDQYVRDKYPWTAEFPEDQEMTEGLHAALKWFLYRKGNPPELHFKKLYHFVLKNIHFGDDMTAQSDEIIKTMSGLTGLHTSDENIFLFRVMEYLSNENIKDIEGTFSRLFWQYLRIKNVVYQGVTQGNYLEGLDYFRTFFGRASSLTVHHLEHALRNQIYNNHLKKLEIRVTPSDKRKDLRENLVCFFRVYKKILEDNSLPYESIPQIGVVYHLIKSQDDTFYEKCWYKDSDRRAFDKTNYFYGKLQYQYQQTVDAVNDLRERIPKLSKYIVGLDAASVENSAEPWVFAPTFSRARDSRVSKIKLLGTDESIQTLGFTYHVGEEFRHLLSGLRHIDEVIEHFHYHVGDRIGHGIALGIDVKAWCRDNPIVVMPRIEYMENLLWLWGQAFMDRSSRSSELDLLGLEREVMLQAEKIYYTIDGITMFTLWKAYQGRFRAFESDERFIREVCITETGRTGKWRNEIPLESSAFCKQTESGGSVWNEQKLLHANHCKCFLERMYEVIQVNVGQHEVDLLERIQVSVRDKLSHKGIVVEANPTSNLAISGIDRLFHHHATRLNNTGIRQEDQAGSGLVISINSDDPAVFNTSISNELSYIFHLLQNKGYPRDSILEWINKIREWGVMTSFIEDRTIGRQDLIKEIDQILKELAG